MKTIDEHISNINAIKAQMNNVENQIDITRVWAKFEALNAEYTELCNQLKREANNLSKIAEILAEIA